MKKAIIKNLTKNQIIISEAEVANTFFTRLIGLTGRKGLAKDNGLIISPCNSIHMIGMRFPIDAIFLDKDKKVCHIIPSMKILQISPIINKARYVIEVQAGTAKRKNIELNDRIEFI